MADQYTAIWNKKNHEWEVYRNGSIFCHLSEGDYEEFIKLFKANVIEQVGYDSETIKVEVKTTH